MASATASISFTEQQLNDFKVWLRAHGATLRAPTNPYEIIRFKARGRVSVMYKKKNGVTSHLTHDARSAYTAYMGGLPWDGTSAAVPKTKEKLSTSAKKKNKKRVDLLPTLFERDGQTCAYCGLEMTYATATIEHFIPLCQGGPDRLYNMVLACLPCNQKASDLGIRKKMELLVKTRIANVF